MIEKIKALMQEVERLKADNAEELEALRIRYLSKRGEINALMNDFRNVAADRKREVGQSLNELKEMAQQKINQLRERFEQTAENSDFYDMTYTPSALDCAQRNM